MTWLTVAIGGTLGALTRYALSVVVGTRPFPWTTLVINISGAFMLAFLVAGPFAVRSSSPVAVYVAASLVLGLLATAFEYWLGQQSA